MNRDKHSWAELKILLFILFFTFLNYVLQNPIKYLSSGWMMTPIRSNVIVSRDCSVMMAVTLRSLQALRIAHHLHRRRFSPPQTHSRDCHRQWRQHITSFTAVHRMFISWHLTSASRLLDWSLNRIGMALTDSLDELITSGAITPQLAMKVLQQVCVLFRRRQQVELPMGVECRFLTVLSV